MAEQSAARDVADARPASARSGIWFVMVLTAFEIGASIAIFQYAEGHGASDIGAYLWACAAPLIGAVVYFLRTRDLSGASIAILAFNALSALVAVIGRTDAKMLLYKDSFATGLIGLIFLATVFGGRPLAYWFGQRIAGGGTREGDAWWEDMWDTYPTFRRSQRVITAVWAVVLLLEAVVKAIAIRLSDYQTGFVWDQILPVVAFVIALALTIWIAKRSQAEGMRRRDAARRESPTAK